VQYAGKGLVGCVLAANDLFALIKIDRKYSGISLNLPRVMTFGKKYPAFSQLGRNNAPEYFSLVGELGNKELFTRKSCFHYVHPNYYVEVVESENEECMDEDEESRDDQLMAVAAGGRSSPRT
jgi:hypothetical protein